MHDLKSGLIVVLRKYMRDPATPIGDCTALDELGIDELDLPMICLDVEDLYSVQIEAGDALGDIETLGDLVARVVSCLAAKTQPRMRYPRRRQGWMSTGAERRR